MCMPTIVCDDVAIECPICGASEWTELGGLGRSLWLRCRYCGCEIPEEDEDDA